MTDYSKLTVVKLKDELKQRGLPIAGLKAALVSRLAEADASSLAAGLVSSEQAVDINSSQIGNDAINHVLDTRAQPEPASNPVALDIEHDDSKQGDAGTAPLIDSHEDQTLPDATPLEVTQDSSSATAKDANTTSQNPSPQPLPHTIGSESVDMDGSVAHNSTGQEEVAEDNRKRKRRSQSPPVSSFDIAIKKAKAADGSPRIKLAEDTSFKHTEEADLDTPTLPTADSRSTNDISQHQDNGNSRDDGPHPLESAGTVPAVSLSSGAVTTTDAEQSQPAPITVEPSKAPVKGSASDPRFSSLFSTQVKPIDASEIDLEKKGLDDREVPAAIHPATTALYIRNFMRPLHQDTLKAHLTSLAQAPSSSPNPEIISTFFIDSIRTHCLVQFSSVSAASRVRAVMHDCVWPNERDRKPLFADFVPEEKLEKWIEVERETPSRGASGKRWEVVYEEENGGIAAYLQEVDTAPKQPAHSNVSRTNGEQLHSHLERAPQAAAPSTVSAPRGDPGKGFKALDHIFKSTVAKPKLYYQPVSEAIVTMRVNKLAVARGGGKGDELRRYSFEDDMIVDKGPEFGSGWRGGYRGRGGVYSGAMSFRGGYRAESDSWRGR